MDNKLFKQLILLAIMTFVFVVGIMAGWWILKVIIKIALGIIAVWLVWKLWQFIQRTK